jgi:hypothetical protein
VIIRIEIARHTPSVDPAVLRRTRTQRLWISLESFYGGPFVWFKGTMLSFREVKGQVIAAMYPFIFGQWPLFQWMMALDGQTPVDVTDAPLRWSLSSEVREACGVAQYC